MKGEATLKFSRMEKGISNYEKAKVLFDFYVCGTGNGCSELGT
jgi:hypothetical protein